MADMYAELLLEAAKNPENFGLLKSFNATAKNYNASCGDQIEVTLQLEGQKVVAIGWQGHGCVISKAHMSAVSEAIIGKTVDQILAMTKSDLFSFFGFDETLSPGREKCFMIGLRTVQQAVSNL